MRLFERWLTELRPSQRILDLGCGAGSLRAQMEGLNVIGADVDRRELARNPSLAGACAESHNLPFADHSFDLVICHHSLEHIRELQPTLAEIRRTLKTEGRLFVSVPDGNSASDRLYRLLFCGGGHWQRFGFEDLVGTIEQHTGLHLAGWKELSTSFNFIDRRNFIPAPRGCATGPLPRRMRWLGLLPGWFFAGARLSLNFGSRFLDRCLPARFSRYGWALAFDSCSVSAEAELPEAEQHCLNVCMSCGANVEQARDGRVARLLYRCPYCSTLNLLFAN